MKTEEIKLRDPYVLLYNNRYYLYGTRSETAFAGQAYGFDVYTSDDLNEWEGPCEVFHRPSGFFSRKCYWAPEVYCYRDRFYMFAIFAYNNKGLGTAVLTAASPMGPFSLYSDGCVTPKEWRCLDGTLYLSQDGVPYMVFCHEWRQIRDGTVCSIRMTDDLKQSTGAAQLLFRASSATPFVSRYFFRNYVTDGPFMIQTEDGRLHMLWSTFTKGGYAVAMAHSDNNALDGNWTVDRELLYDRDGGHGMIFQSKEKQYYLALHYPNTFKKEHTTFIPLVYWDGVFRKA